MLHLAVAILVSYLIGAIPFGYLIARARGVDILSQGSGNIGATNVGRVLGRPFGVMVFVLDFAKGALPSALGLWIERSQSPDLPAHLLPVSAGLAAFLGHLFPIYLRFRGGKGVATGAGVVAVLLPIPALAAFLTWLAVLSASRFVSLASLAAVTILCTVELLATGQPFGQENRILTLFCLVAALLVFVRHRGNIGRLLRGNENRLKESTAMSSVGRTIHVMAMGLWFGTIVFFTVAALIIFQSFEAADLPVWIPALTKEQRTQLAGLAVGPIFPWFFLIQGICGLLALVTGWFKPSRRIDKVRFLVLALAFATVLAGWPIAEKVGELRKERYSLEPTSTAAESILAEFGKWHGISLLINFATLVLVAAGTGLAAHLPKQTAESSGFPEKVVT
jgi:glycerol-3-phosphate acyltransferase PlsY